MIVEAEKYAVADKQKRESIDLKNQAEALCLEAEKELYLLKEEVSEPKQTETTKLIERIRQDIQAENLEQLKINLEQLKEVMKDLIQSKSQTNPTNSDSLSDLNDI